MLPSFSKKFIVVFVIVVLSGIIVLYFFLGKPPFKKTASPSPLTNFSTPKPGNCLILEEKYCKQGTIIANPNFPEDKFMAFKVPAGTTLFSPVDGESQGTSDFSFKDTSKGGVVNMSGTVVIVSKDGTVQTISAFYNLIYYKQGQKETSRKIKKGEILGQILDKNLPVFTNYNLVFGITKQKYTDKIKQESGFDEIKNIFK